MKITENCTLTTTKENETIQKEKRKGFKTVYLKKWNNHYDSNRPSPVNQSREIQD